MSNFEFWDQLDKQIKACQYIFQCHLLT